VAFSSFEGGTVSRGKNTKKFGSDRRMKQITSGFQRENLKFFLDGFFHFAREAKNKQRTVSQQEIQQLISMSINFSARFDDFDTANVLRNLSNCGCSWSNKDRTSLSQLKDVYLSKKPSIEGSILFLTSLNKLQFPWTNEKKEPLLALVKYTLHQKLNVVQLSELLGSLAGLGVNGEEVGKDIEEALRINIDETSLRYDEFHRLRAVVTALPLLLPNLSQRGDQFIVKVFLNLTKICLGHVVNSSYLGVEDSRTVYFSICCFFDFLCSFQVSNVVAALSKAGFSKNSLSLEMKHLIISSVDKTVDRMALVGFAMTVCR
jgi:hypothetical protein